MTLGTAAVLFAAAGAGLFWLKRSPRFGGRQKKWIGILLGAVMALALVYGVLTLLLLGGID